MNKFVHKGWQHKNYVNANNRGSLIKVKEYNNNRQSFLNFILNIYE